MDLIRSVIQFIGQNMLNWKILLFILLQTMMTYNLTSSLVSWIIIFFYTFLCFLFLFCPCPINVWYSTLDVRLTITIFIVFIYSIYTAFIPFYYPRKKSSYFVFQYFINLLIYYIIFFFFYFFFCKNYSGNQVEIPTFFQ